MTVLRIVDLETCGLPPDDCQIVEVACVDLVLEPAEDDGRAMVWKRGRMWSSLVNPGRPIPPVASAVHHITDAMVAEAPAFHTLVPSIVGGEPSYFVAHNARFEIVCVAAFDKLRPPIIAPSRWLCTYKAAVTLWPEAPSHGNQALRYWLKLNLAEEPGPPHRALGDAYVTAAIARRILAHSPRLEDWADVSSKPVFLPSFRFGKHQGMPIAELPIDYLEWVVQNIRDDEDVVYTSRVEIERRREARRSRSPV
jgi:exodeoxyribonuclease X